MKEYICPKCKMEYDEPGVCTMDGAILIKNTKIKDSTEMSKHNHGDNNHDEHKGHHDHHKMMLEDFKKRFIGSIIITIPILLLSPLIQNLL